MADKEEKGEDQDVAPQAQPERQPRPNEVTFLVYEQMWDYYRDGTRLKADLAQRFGIHKDTAARAVERGWPERGFIALKERAREHDEMKMEAERKVALDKHREITDAWYKAGKQFNRVADNAVAFCIAALSAVSSLAATRDAEGRLSLRPLTKWVKRRNVRVVEGQRVVEMFDEEVPLTVSEGIKVQAQLLKSAALAGAFKRLWPLTSDSERAQDGEPGGLAALTMEQLQHIAETGQLPEGVSAEDVFGVGVPGMPSKGRRTGN